MANFYKKKTYSLGKKGTYSFGIMKDFNFRTILGQPKNLLYSKIFLSIFL